MVNVRFLSTTSDIWLRLKFLSSKAAVLTVAFAVLALISTRDEVAMSAESQSVSLDAGFHQMYNLDFAGAHKTFKDWEALHPDDPLGPASNAAAYLFDEFDRLHILEFDIFTENRQVTDLEKLPPDPKIKSALESELASADEIASKTLAQSPHDPNALFARVLSDGLKGNYAALIEQRKREALNFFKSSRSIAEQLIAIDPAYHDAYLAIGIENYLLGIRSAPTRWVLRLTGAQTNKEKGIANLKIASDQGRYLAPYARVLLVIAYLRDDDRNTARDLLADLARKFPRNSRYQIELERLRT